MAGGYDTIAMQNIAAGSGSPRSGWYKRQPSGYLAFIPAVLPPTPALRYDKALLEALSKADRALGRLDGVSVRLPNEDLFVHMYIRKEAVLSSQIEGTQSSLTELLEMESHVRKPRHPDDAMMTANYVAAMDLGLKRLQTLPVSLRLVKEIHARLMLGARGGQVSPGEFRTSQNWIGPEGAKLMDAMFVPPPPDEMNNALGRWEMFLHDKEPMPILVKVGLAHAQFETIHPFLDGNGRIGRLLITFLLCEKEVLRRPLLYLSYFFKQNRTEYYDRLQATRDRGDWEGWLKFFLRAVSEVSNHAAETALQIIELRESTQQLIREKMGRGAGTALRILDDLFLHPSTTAKLTMQKRGMTFAGARRPLERLSELGILWPDDDERERRYLFRSYLDLLVD